MVDLNDVVVLGVGQIADAPLEAIRRVLANEDRVRRVGLHKIRLGIEALALVSDLVLPGGLAELLRALPLAQLKFIACHVALLH